MRFETLRVSDHPVCGASVASRLFSDAAATPPHEEGNAHRLNNSRIRAQAHRPPLQTSLRRKPPEPGSLSEYFFLSIDMKNELFWTSHVRLGAKVQVRR